jgi:putative membrane protein
MEVEERADLRDVLAAERTFLSWIRTGLALMGFGFVVARFGLFLQEFQIAQHGEAFTSRSSGLSRWFGTSLIAVGVIVNAVAAWHHARLVRELERGGTPPARPSTVAIVVACVLALVGLAMVVYLFSVQAAPLPIGNLQQAP